MKENPLVSIIIINYNGRSYLEKCLEALMKINYSNFEVILVDNASTDNSIEFVQESFPSVIIKKLDKNYGFAKPNNIGAKLSNGDLLLFLNNDTKVEKNFLNELIHGLYSEPDIVICQSLLLKPNDSIDSSGDFLDEFGRAYSSRIKPKKVSPILSARGACMLIKREVFWKLGGFDENFFASFEDVDLGWRSWLMGYKVVVVPNSIVYHYGGSTVKTMKEEIQFHGAKNTLILRLTNFELIFAIKGILVLSFVTFGRKIFKKSIIGDPEESPPLPSNKIILKTVSWILRNLQYILKKRKTVSRLRIKSTKELIQMGLITKKIYK